MKLPSPNDSSNFNIAMLATTRHILRQVASPRVSSSTAWRFKSSPSVPEDDSHTYAFDENGEIAEFVDFSVAGKKSNDREQKPILLNAKEHAVGYLSKILNARVYEAAIETELQEAKNLSTVRSLVSTSHGCLLGPLIHRTEIYFPVFFECNSN